MGDKTKSEPLRHPKEATEGDLDVVSGENPLAFSTNGKAEIKSKPCIVAAREAERIFSEQKTIGFDINPPENHLAQFAQRKTNEEGFQPCNTAHDPVRTENEADLVDISDLKEILEAEDKGSSVGSDTGKVCVDYAVEHGSHTLTRQDFQDSDELDEFITQAITVLEDGPFAFPVPGSAAPLTNPGTAVSVPSTDPGPAVSVPSTDPGPAVSVPSTDPGPAVSVPSTDPGPAVSVPSTDPGPAVSVPSTDPGPAVSVPSTDPGPAVSVPSTDPGPAVSVPSTDPGPAVSVPSTDPGPAVSVPSTDPGPAVSVPSTDPGPAVSVPSTDPGPAVSVPSTDPGPAVSVPSTDPGTAVSVPSTDPGPAVSVPSTDPGPAVSVPSTDPGPAVSVPSADPGPAVSVPSTDPGTAVSVPSTDPGPAVSVPSTDPGPAVSVPSADPGPAVSVPSADPGSVVGTLTAVPGFVKGTADTLFTSNLFPLHHGFQGRYMLFLVAISLCAICVNAAELIQPTQKLPECIDLMKQKHGNDCSPPNDPFFWKRFEELNKTCCSDYPGKVFHCQKLYKAGKEFTMIACLTPKDVPPAYTGKISKYDTPSPIFTLVKQNVSEVKKKTSRKSYQETLRYGADEKNRCQGPGQEILCEGNVDNLCMCKVGFHLGQAGKDCNQGIGAHDACHCEPLNCSRGNHAVRSFSQEINGSCHELFRNFTPHFACEKDPTPAPSVVSSTTKSSVSESSTSLPPNTTKSGGDDDANDDKKALKIALPILFAVLILVGGVLLFVFRCKLCCSPCGGEPATGTAKGSMGFKKNRESVSIDLSTGSTDPVGEELA